MSPSSVTVDMTADLDMNPSTSKAGNGPKRTLLLAPPSVATREETLRDLFKTFDRPTTDLQMLDRLSAGHVSLPRNTYDYVLVLSDSDDSRTADTALGRAVYTALVPSMKVGAN